MIVIILMVLLRSDNEAVIVPTKFRQQKQALTNNRSVTSTPKCYPRLRPDASFGNSERILPIFLVPSDFRGDKFHCWFRELLFPGFFPRDIEFLSLLPQTFSTDAEFEGKLCLCHLVLVFQDKLLEVVLQRNIVIHRGFIVLD